MDEQDARTFVAALAKLSPKQRSAAWAELTPEDCAVAFAALSPHEREADADALDEAYIEEDGITPNAKQRRRELVERDKDLIRKGLLVDYGRRDGMAVLVATKYLTADGVFTGYEPNSPPLTSKRIHTHDFSGNEPEGQYWDWTEESFERFATGFRAAGNDRAAAIADQLVATTDNMPAEIMAEYQGLWNKCGDLGDDDDDPTEDDDDLTDSTRDLIVKYTTGDAADADAAAAAVNALRAALPEVDIALGRLEALQDQMMEEIGRGEFIPDDATAFAQEFIRRASGIMPA
jgi:hypothetical protein